MTWGPVRRKEISPFRGTVNLGSEKQMFEKLLTLPLRPLQYKILHLDLLPISIQKISISQFFKRAFFLFSSNLLYTPEKQTETIVSVIKPIE